MKCKYDVVCVFSRGPLQSRQVTPIEQVLVLCREQMSMQLETSYEISVPDIVAEDFTTEIVVLNLANGKYFSLTGVAASLWNDIAAGHRPQDILDRLSAQVKDTEAVRTFILDLIREELIRPVEVTVASVPADMACTTAASDIDAEPPRLEAFDDMAELILSDPIHDVDEDVGWPVKRTLD